STCADDAPTAVPGRYGPCARAPSHAPALCRKSQSLAVERLHEMGSLRLKAPEGFPTVSRGRVGTLANGPGGGQPGCHSPGGLGQGTDVVRQPGRDARSHCGAGTSRATPWNGGYAAHDCTAFTAECSIVCTGCSPSTWTMCRMIISRPPSPSSPAYVVGALP